LWVSVFNRAVWRKVAWARTPNRDRSLGPEPGLPAGQELDRDSGQLGLRQPRTIRRADQPPLGRAATGMASMTASPPSASYRATRFSARARRVAVRLWRAP